MSLNGITIQKDEKGNPKKATFDLKKHPYIEDYLDNLLIDAAKDEERVPFEDVKKKILKKLSSKKKTGGV